MKVLLAMLAAAAPVPVAPRPVFDCRLVTPNGDPIAFAAHLGSPTGVLDPDPRSAWPKSRVIGPGELSESKGLEAEYTFAAGPNGAHLKVKDERAILYVGKTLRSGYPRAYGFCLRSNDAAPLPPNTMVSASAGANVPAFDSARWPDDCALMTRSGRRARMAYNILEMGARSAFTIAAEGFLPEQRTVATRKAGTGRSRFSGPNGLSGTETLFIDEKTSTGVQLIDFDRLGIAPAPVEPAAAICGLRSVIRRPNVG